MQKMFIFLLIFLATSCSNSPSYQPNLTPDSGQKLTPKNTSFNDQDYTEILKKYVTSSGLVDYQGLKSDRQQLDRFNAALAAVPLSEIQAWTQAAKIAFFINAYNSLTLVSIINHYPISSIRQIPGVWDRQKFPLAGTAMTLNYIEHEILRKQFNEPRIHLALVCASRGCPQLRTEPYRGDRLDEQLKEQTRIFLSDKNNFYLDKKNKKVYVSSLFKWFGEDFEKTFAKSENWRDLNKKETAFLNFISPYLSAEDQAYLAQGGYRVNYLEYDWSLNDKL